MRTKTILFAMVVLGMLSGCRSFDASLLTKKEFVDKSVPPMKVFVNKKSIDACYAHCLKIYEPWNEDARNIEEIHAVIRNNFNFESGTGNAFLSVIIRKVEMFENGLIMLPFFMTITAIGVLGYPAYPIRCTIELEVAILKSDGSIVKTYSASGRDSEYTALYWGYFHGDRNRTALHRALHVACSDIREQLRKDAPTISILIKKEKP